MISKLFVVKTVLLSCLLVICIVGVYVSQSYSANRDFEKPPILEEPVELTLTPEPTRVIKESSIQASVENFNRIVPIPVKYEETPVIDVEVETIGDPDMDVPEEIVSDNTTEEESNDVVDTDITDTPEMIDESSYTDESSDTEVSEYVEVEEVPEEVQDEEEYVEGDSNTGYWLEYLGDWTITAYCGCAECCGSWGNATASGATPISGYTVACNVLPFGTTVQIGDNTYVVQDTGSTPYGDAWMDIYFDTHPEAEAFGLHVEPVYIVHYE